MLEVEKMPPKPKSSNALSWIQALKMWNMHKKIYDPTHIYAIVKKNTPEFMDVKHIQEHGALPAHLHKKAPFPAGALEQLRKHESESKARREAVKEKEKHEKFIELMRSQLGSRVDPTLRIQREEEEEEEEAPKIKVPALPARIKQQEEAQEEKIAFTPKKVRKPRAKKVVDTKTKDIQQFVPAPAPKKVTPARAKIIAAILAEAKKRKEAKAEERPNEQDVPDATDILLSRPAGPRGRKAPTFELPDLTPKRYGLEGLATKSKTKTVRGTMQSEYDAYLETMKHEEDYIKSLEEKEQDKIGDAKRFGADFDYWKSSKDKIDYFKSWASLSKKGQNIALRYLNNASIRKAFDLYKEKGVDALKGFRYTSKQEVEEPAPAPKKVTPAKAKVIAAILAEAKKRKEAKAGPDLETFDAIKELGEDGKEPKKKDTVTKLKKQSESIGEMYRRLVGLLKEAKDIPDARKQFKTIVHLQNQMYAVEELQDRVKEARSN